MSKDKSAFEFDEALASQLNLLFGTEALKKARGKYFEILSARTGDLVLDIGTGTAANAMALVDYLSGKCRVIGVDNSQAMLAIGEKNLQDFAYRSAIELKLNDGHSLPFGNNHFDAAMIIQVLEYSNEPVRMLQEAKRVLIPGGKLLVVDTDWDTVVWNSPDREKTRKILFDWSDHEADGWQGRKIQEYLRKAGFENFEHEVYVIVQNRFNDTDYSCLMARIMTDYLVRAGKLEKESVESWVRDLREQDRKGFFYFSLNRYIYLATKE